MARGYIVKSGYQVLKQDKTIVASAAVIWYLKVDSKIRIFLWKVFFDAIPYCFEL